MAHWGVKLERFLMNTPIRTCVGCRKQEPKNQLIRIVLSGSRATPATGEINSGRGVYVHSDPECISNAVNRKLIVRGLNSQANLDQSAVLELAKTK